MKQVSSLSIFLNMQLEGDCEQSAFAFCSPHSISSQQAEVNMESHAYHMQLKAIVESTYGGMREEQVGTHTKKN